MSITCVENFSNEIFHEIFDYLNGCDVYQAFSNLNNRFQEILHCPSLRFKIKLYSSSNKILLNYSKQVKLLNKHQIFSIDMWSGLYIKKFLSTFITDSSLDRLESVTLHYIRKNTLISLLNKLICLPRLFALNVLASLHDLSDVYRLIFALPKLKHMKITSVEWPDFASLPVATTKQEFSSVKYLVIDHCCTFDQLLVILSYTSELCHLEFEHEDVRNSNMEMIYPITLSNLTYFSMDITYLDYDEFKEFIQKISSKLKVFHLTMRSNDVLYLVSVLWEQLIVQDFPKLEKFYLKYFEPSDDEDRFGDYLWPDDQFASSFWIERQWIFQAEIETYEITYSICPYKKTWYNYADRDTNYNLPTLKINLRICSEDLKLLLKNIMWISTTTTIYHLELCRQVHIRTLIKILDNLPSLDSLKICSLLLLKPKRLSSKEKQYISIITETNQITKVYLENLKTFQQILSLIDLFPRMKFLQIGFTSNIHIQSFLQIILKKILNKSSNLQLRSLCLCSPLADDQIVKNIQQIIDQEKFIFDYRIKRVCNAIYLQWNSSSSFE